MPALSSFLVLPLLFVWPHEVNPFTSFWTLPRFIILSIRHLATALHTFNLLAVVQQRRWRIPAVRHNREQGCHQLPLHRAKSNRYWGPPALQLSGRFSIKVLPAALWGSPWTLQYSTNSTLLFTGNFHMTFGLSPCGPHSVDWMEFLEVRDPASDQGDSTAGACIQSVSPAREPVLALLGCFSYIIVSGCLSCGLSFHFHWLFWPFMSCLFCSETETASYT